MSQLCPSPKMQVCDVDGVPMVGAKLYTYTAGTSTPKPTYTAAELLTQNTNPVVFDSRGEADVWLDGAYKLTLKDAEGVLIWSVDNVRDLTSSPIFNNATLTGTVTVTATNITWATNTTHSGNHTFTNNVELNGNVTIGDNNVDSFIVNSNAVTWNAAMTTHASNHTWSGVQTYSQYPAGKILGNLYAPTMATDTNCTAVSVLGGWRYVRVGPVVHVTGALSIDPTSTTTPTIFTATLPIASTMTAATDLSGVCTYDSSGVMTTGYVKTLNTDYTKAWFYHTSINTAAYTGYVSFSYEVK